MRPQARTVMWWSLVVVCVVAVSAPSSASTVTVPDGESVAASDDPGPDDGSGSPARDTLSDNELVDAMAAVGLVDEWSAVGTLDRRSNLVTVQGEGIEGARDEFVAGATELAELRPRVAELVELAAQLDEADEFLRAERTHLEAKAAVTTMALGVVDDALGDATVARYVRGHDLPPSGHDPEEVYTDATHGTLVNVAIDDLLARHRGLEERLAGFAAEVDALVEAMVANGETRRVARADLDAIEGRWQHLEVRVPELFDDLARRRMGGTVEGLGLSLVTLDSYLTAETVIAERHPECGLRWQVIAALARVESNHGRDQGAQILPDGRVSAPFLGPVLDGSLEGTAVVGDTDGGALDGNAEFDRAVGPFQFLPGSWRAGGLDGNGDGVVDVHNLYDGAAAAGEYLCSRLSPLTTDEALRQSFRYYNNSAAYVDHVAEWVHTYDEFHIDPTPLGSDDLAAPD